MSHRSFYWRSVGYRTRCAKQYGATSWMALQLH